MKNKIKITLPEFIDTPEKFMDWINTYYDYVDDILFIEDWGGYDAYGFSIHDGKILYYGYGGEFKISVPRINQAFHIYVDSTEENLFKIQRKIKLKYLLEN